MEFTQHEIRSYFQTRIPCLRITNQREWRSQCPVHDGKDPNFSINSENGLSQCHSQCGRGWDILSLEEELSGSDFATAKRSVFEIIGRPEVPWEERNLEAAYDYVDQSGKVLYQVLRYHGKKFMQRRPDGHGGWSWGLGEVERVPFRLPRVVESTFVAITEGEKDALTLERLGMAATCNNGGAGNFKPELAKWFKGKRVAIFPDHDEPGRDHALKVAALLSPVAASVKIVEIPGLPPKGDVSDFVASGGTIEQLRDLYSKAQDWTAEWQFSEDVPNENDRHLHTFREEIQAAGGPIRFWDLTKLQGIRTPWNKLSRVLGGGMRDGEVYVIGANQGAGKTSLALQFIIEPLRKKLGVLLFSMEMSAKAVFQRLAGIEAKVDLNELRDAQINWKIREDPEAVEALQGYLGALEKQTAELTQCPLLVSTRAAVSPEYIVSETTRLRKRQKISLVVVDHMQLMGSSGHERSDYEKFTAISRAMKQVAVEVGLPLLLVSQTSRRNSSDHRTELEVSDLRGSGAIEEDAAAVMLLYEDKTDRERALADMSYARGPVKSWLKIAKNRYGMQGAYMALTHYKNWTRFDPPEEAEASRSAAHAR